MIQIKPFLFDFTSGPGFGEYYTKQSIQLLALLLNSPDYFLTYQEIINQLWGPIENKGQERLTQSIKRLRESLEEFPEIIIENLRGAGYQLKIDNKDNNSKNKD